MAEIPEEQYFRNRELPLEIQRSGLERIVQYISSSLSAAFCLQCYKSSERTKNGTERGELRACIMVLNLSKLTCIFATLYEPRNTKISLFWGEKNEGNGNVWVFK